MVSFRPKLTGSTVIISHAVESTTQIINSRYFSKTQLTGFFLGGGGVAHNATFDARILVSIVGFSDTINILKRDTDLYPR